MKNKRNYLILIPAVLFLLSCFFLKMPESRAISQNAGISNPGTVDQSNEAVYTVEYSVTTDSPMTADLNITVGGGGQFVGASASPASAGGTKIVLGGRDDVTAISGTISFKAVGAEAVIIAITGDVSSVDDFSTAPVNASVTIQVRSIEAQEASIAEAYSIAASISEAESIAQSSREEEESIWQSIAAEESERQAAIDASVNASIAEEQRRIAESQAAEEASRNASIAESESIRQSEAEESLSAEESKARESREESRREESSKEESRKEESRREAASRSESETGKTEESTEEKEKFIPIELSEDEDHFLLAAEDMDVALPEGFRKSKLLVGERYV
ncbi:MAG: hypothetical protein IKR59_01350, partial [Lachnospiraceae bacterium]|nr:hypothetical protein [Lachnospiraceae bacterium]